MSARWRWQAANHKLPPMTFAQAAAWTAFLTECLGSAGRYCLGRMTRG